VDTKAINSNRQLCAVSCYTFGKTR